MTDNQKVYYRDSEGYKAYYQGISIVNGYQGIGGIDYLKWYMGWWLAYEDDTYDNHEWAELRYDHYNGWNANQ